MDDVACVQDSLQPACMEASELGACGDKRQGWLTKLRQEIVGVGEFMAGERREAVSEYR